MLPTSLPSAYCSKIKEHYPCGSDGKESACNVGDLGSIPELGRSPGGGDGNPLHYSCLENPTDKGAWWSITIELKSRTRLSDEHTHRLQSGKKQGCLLWPQLLNDICNFLKNANKITLKINMEKEVSYAMIVYLESYNLCGTQVALVVKNCLPMHRS